ncbi:MAG: hypothetical protein AAGA67_01000 [Cyanobacteria bacterium P01_F01_bin.153]
MISPKKFLVSAAAIAGTMAIAAPANALSLKAEKYGDLFDTFNSMVNTERLRMEDSTAALYELDVESLGWDSGAEGIDVFFTNEGEPATATNCFTQPMAATDR